MADKQDADRAENVVDAKRKLRKRPAKGMGPWRRRRDGIITENDGIYSMIGIFASGIAGGLSTKKHSIYK
jgi:hypothetical protein